MKITKETDYAMRIVLFLSMNKDRTRRFSGDELVEVNEIPKNLGKRILTKLVEGKIMNSKKGIGGGFTLERSADKITLFDVMNVIENMEFKDCTVDKEGCTFKRGICAINTTMEKVKANLFEELKSINFAELVKLEDNIQRHRRR